MENTMLSMTEIKPFGINYIEDVSEIHFQVFDGWSMKSLISDIANSATKSYVAVCGGRALAFVSYLMTDDAEMLFVCTHPAYRHSGLATKLIKETIAAMPDEIHRVVLEVRSKNREAISLYKKLGFVELGVRRDFYTTPKDDAIVMELNFRGAKELD